MGKDSGGTQTNVNEFKPPSYITDAPGGNLFSQYLDTAQNLSEQSYPQFGGMRVAPMNEQQNLGLQLVSDAAQNGTPVQQSGQEQNVATTRGAYLNTSPGMQANVTPGQNQYMNNPYLDSVINQNADLMNRQYQQGSQASLDAMAARGGGFGGSGWQQMTNQGQAGLASAIGNMGGQMRLQDLNSVRGLEEANLGRGLQADMYNNQAQQNAWAGERGNQMHAMDTSMGMYQQDINAGKALTGVGDAYQAQTQRLLDQNYSDFQNQAQYPWMMLDNFGNALQRASGGGGTTSSVMSQNGGGMSTIGGLLGGGALGLAAGNYLGWGR